MQLISKNISMAPESPSSHIDSRTFLLLLKHLTELRMEVLDNKAHEITPQSFFVFLDKVSTLTNSDKLNEYIMRKLAEINIDMLNVDKMLNAYHQHSYDDQFEESVRIEEIKKFAAGVVPETRFIFDNYKVSNLNEAKALQDRSLEIEDKLMKIQKDTQTQKPSLKDTEDSDSGLEDNKPKLERTPAQSSISQYSEPDDYFSFLSSHEKLLLRPEKYKTFKHIRKFIKYLPVDYYVLLQENFDSRTKFEESNYVMFRNLPVIAKTAAKFRKYACKHVTYEDISKCDDKDEIEQLLSEELALEELIHQLEKYGPVEDAELINFNKDDVTEIISRATAKPTRDEMSSFEKMMQRAMDVGEAKGEIDGFENVLRAHRNDLLRQFKFKATKSNKDIAKEYLDLSQKEQEEIATSILRKGRQMKNLNKGIFLHGLLKFKDYESKLKFLISPAYKFGMKFYDQPKNIHFFDADFGNTLSVQSREFANKSLLTT
mmetsp:Transcript_41745/g.48214  ORF Transcript_41745/g.48214 Transcript_41745/m.48214 type:complete len:487 (-) Transcript_41745:436-1896(-)